MRSASDLRDLIKLGIVYQYLQIFAYFLGLIPGLRTVADRLLYLVLRVTANEYTPMPDVINSRIGYAYFHRHWQIVLEFLRLRRPLLSVRSFTREMPLWTTDMLCRRRLRNSRNNLHCSCMVLRNRSIFIVMTGCALLKAGLTDRRPSRLKACIGL